MNNPISLLSSLSAIVALLLPTGLLLIAGSGLAGRRPARSAVAGLGAIALAAAGFWASGFAFQFGGIGLVANARGLDGLVWEWASPLNLEWGVLGLRGFFLLGDAATPAALTLFLAYLPAVSIAVLLPMLSLHERLPGWMAALGGLLLAAVVYPVAGNWFTGGGWLMHTGQTLGLGHGYVDPAGLSSAAVVGGVAALVGITFFGRRLPPLAEGELPALPPVHLPVMAALGAALLAVGGAALLAADPLHLQAGLPLTRAAVNLILAVAGGALVPSLYTWFTAGAADSLMAARGVAAAVLAAAATAAWAPPWTAFALGAAAGLLVPLLTFAVQSVLRIDEPTGAVAIGLTGGLLGVLAPGLLADGQSGAGWNGTGLAAYLGMPGQGITGLLAAPGMVIDWPGQINAQFLGLAAIAGLTAVLCGVLFLLLRIILIWWPTKA